ncbi:hypothetical protein [Bradyrhizobium sp.]|uniref:hypothetical protein n=1 Tax=Bradyrhizobium sp. TaxID=376 RepID=UPI001DEB8766|nr:hypothetical protein [Bradyrhizobium sp.]MBV8699369.1 hypothetical protein [Bradyrhizobium sp.]MBV8918637.1 hypothetical protein [Bradyrhizobium sp.]MBV9981471.1 hypothetical protein [Bradyrhizobium sp.]
MADIQIYRQIKKGRTFLRVEVTPKSAETRKLLRQFQAGVREFEKNWKATDAYRAARKAKKAKKKKTAK